MRASRLTVAFALVACASACGDDEAAEATTSPATPETPTPPPEPAPDPEQRPPAATPDPPPEEPAPAELPPLDSPDAIRAALLAARPSTAAVWSLTDPERGLDLDFNWVSGHFVHTACTESDLSTWRDWAREDGFSFYRLAEGDPFNCTPDLSLCASCPEDISSCERGTVFELATGAGGRRYLYGVIMAPGRSEALWDLSDTTLQGVRRARVDLGSAAETGAKCAIRAWLAEGEVESLWVERASESGEREAARLEGDEARDFARALAARFGLSAYCVPERCVVAGDGGELFGVYYRRGRRRRRRPPPPPRVWVVTQGMPECEGCAPEPSREVRRMARRARRRR